MFGVAWTRSALHSLSRLELVFLFQVLEEELDIKEYHDGQQAAFTFFAAMAELGQKRCIIVGQMPASCFIWQVFTLHILYHPSTFQLKYYLFDQTEFIPANLWLPRFQRDWTYSLSILHQR